MKIVSFICAFACMIFFIPEMECQEADSLLLNSKAKKIYDQAIEYKSQNEFSSALPLFREIELLYVESNNWEEQINISLELNEIYEAIGDSLAREKNFHKTISNAEKYNPSSKNYGKVLRKRGEYFIEIGELQKASDDLSKSIQVNKNNAQWNELAWSYLILSVVNYYNAELDSMEFNIDSAVNLVDNRIAEPEEFLGSIDQLQSILYNETGDLKNASIAAEKSLQRFKEIPNLTNADSIGLANAYNIIGAIKEELGDYELSIQNYKIALSLHEKIENSPLSSRINIGNNLSLVYKKKEEWKQAEFYLNNSQSQLSKLPSKDNFQEWIQTYQLLAANYIDLEKNVDGIQLLEQIIPISEQYGYYQEWVYGSYGRALIINENPQKAITYLDKSIDKLKSIYGAKHQKIALMLRLKGQANLALEKSKEALESFQQGLEALTAEGNPELKKFGNPKLEYITGYAELIELLYFKGITLKQLNEGSNISTEAIHDTYYTAIKLIDFLRSNYQSEDAKLILSSKAKAIYEAYIEVLYDDYTDLKDQDIIAEVFYYFEKSKSLLLLENIENNTKIKQVSSEHKEGSSFFNQIINERKKIKTELLIFQTKLKEEQLSKGESNKLKIEKIDKSIADLYINLNEVESKIKLHFPTFSGLQNDSIITELDSFQRELLDPNSVCIEYFVGEETTYAIIITKDKTHLLKIGSSIRLRELVIDFQKQLSDYSKMSEDVKGAIKSYNQIALSTYDYLLKPIIDKIPLETNALVIIPDDILNTLSFEALIKDKLDIETGDFGKLPFLIFDYNFQYGYSANTLLQSSELLKNLKSNTRCLAMAPAYNSQNAKLRSQLNLQRNESAELPGTAAEIKVLSSLFNGKFEVGESATESTFKNEVNDFGIVHLATHGVADLKNPNFGYLIFADQKSDGDEDNLLYQHEIVNTEMSCQLAVLSACETGLGKYNEGEGVFSLARGFSAAGVPSIVMSLWKINDKSTSEIIPKFYENLSNRMTKDEALQRAKIDFLQNTEPKFRHPYYWSGLVLIGEDQALKATGGTSDILFYILIFLILITLTFLVRKKLLKLLK